MNMAECHVTLYRPALWKRTMQASQFILCVLLSIVFVVGGFWLAYQLWVFALLGVIGSLWLMVFQGRISYQIAFRDRVILTPEGIEYSFLGIEGFAPYSDMLAFDYDESRAWLHTVYATSDYRHATINILGFRYVLPVAYPTIWGIRLAAEPELSKSIFSAYPRDNRDFIPLSGIVSIPRKHHAEILEGKFLKSDLGQDLLHYAPHLFELREHHVNTKR